MDEKTTFNFEGIQKIIKFRSTVPSLKFVKSSREMVIIPLDIDFAMSLPIRKQKN